jgi:hypothetical protein
MQVWRHQGDDLRGEIKLAAMPLQGRCQFAAGRCAALVMSSNKVFCFFGLG